MESRRPMKASGSCWRRPTPWWTGRFILAQRDLTLIYKGSRNQRIIDMNRTRAEGKLVLDPVEEENLRPEE